jgi:3'-phosphoadenosine 5'-phosphosulfate sulfotransferase (PAPS reductase)/FAD synthetase
MTNKTNKQMGFGSAGVDGFGVSVKVLVGKEELPDLPDLDSFEIIGVSVSGGADSQECANIAIDRFGLDRVRFVHAMVEDPNTPFDELIWEIQANVEHIKYLEQVWGKGIERVLVFNPNKSPGGHKPNEMLNAPDDEFNKKVSEMTGLTRIVLNNDYMPGSGFAYCTESKSLVLERWARQFDSDKFLHVWGQRAEEGTRRAKMPEYGLSEYKRYVWRPIHKWKKEQVRESLANRGQKINPVYESGLAHAGNCKFCINQKSYEVRKAVRLFPKEAQLFVNRIEKVVGPRRDYSVEQAIIDAAHEQELPGMFEEIQKIEELLPQVSCGTDKKFGCID